MSIFIPDYYSIFPMSLLSIVNINILDFYWLVFTRDTFIHHVTSKLFMSLSLMQICCSQHIDEFWCFCIELDNLSSIHVFRSFTFIVIINIVELTFTVLDVFYVFHKSVFFPLSV